MRQLYRQLGQSVVRNNSDNGIRQRHEVMIKAFQCKAVKVGEITGHVKGGNRTHAHLHIDCAGEPSIDQQDAVLELLTFTDESFVRRDATRLGYKLSDRTLFG